MAKATPRTARTVSGTVRRRGSPSAQRAGVRAAGDVTLTRTQLAALTKVAAAARSESMRSSGADIAVFAGPDARAKASAVDALAVSIGRSVYRVDLTRVVSKYIGETEKNLGRVFAKADAATVVVYFDEADSLFGKRTDAADAHDRYANLEVGYLLGRLDGFAGLVVVSSNMPAVSLHPALVKRARWNIEFSEA